MSDSTPSPEKVCAALQRGDPQEVASLIAEGADVSSGDRSYHPLLVALHGRDISRDPHLLELLSLLIQHGVRLNAVSDYQESALRSLRTPADSTRCGCCSMQARTLVSSIGHR